MAERVKELQRKTAIQMSIPSLLMVLLVSVIPLFNAIILSVQNYNLVRPQNRGFIGLKNYATVIFTDTEFYGVLGYSLIYAVSVVAISYVVGFCFALLLNRDIRLKGVYRALILVPWIVPTAVSATNWSWILNDTFGYINVMLKNIGLLKEPILFLAVPNLARITVIFTGAWKAFPFMTVVLLAGLQSIPKELYEVSDIDGAGPIKSFINITIPMLRSVSIVAISLMFIWSFNNFENIYLLTRGGPAEATFVLPILGYYTAFHRYNIGYASTIAILMLFVLLFIVMIYMRANKTVNPYERGKKC